MSIEKTKEKLKEAEKILGEGIELFGAIPDTCQTSIRHDCYHKISCAHSHVKEILALLKEVKQKPAEPEPTEFTKLARSCIPPRECFDNIPITDLSERPTTLESVVHTACDIIDRLSAELEQLKALLIKHRICSTCGKQLSKAEAESVHTCEADSEAKRIAGENKTVFKEIDK